MKTALITGANKSIGLETARQLLQLGYYVYLGSRDAGKGAAAIKQLKAEGLTNVAVIEINVSDSASIEKARQILGTKLKALDVLINNAGISGGFPQLPTAVSMETIREVFDTNFFGTINVTLQFLDLLKNADEPRIVNVTSGLASLTLHSDPNWKYYYSKNGAYGPSKTALNTYTVHLAKELADTKFKINAVDPGFTKTDFNDHRGIGDVHDAAAIIVKYATIGPDGPTGKYFSQDIDGEDKESPW